MKTLYSLVLTLMFAATSLCGAEKPYVIGKLSCELGNNLFQVAAASALAWDNRAEPYFPDLVAIKNNGMPANYEHVLFRCKTNPPNKSPKFRWKLPTYSNFCYMPIPYKPNMVLEEGTFQSEKFFAHHRQRIVDLFTPKPEDLAYIQSKYGNFLSHPCTVGVQMRWFGRQHDLGWQDYLVQYGDDFFKQAVAHFPEDTLFIVSSNNKEFAKKNFPKSAKNVLFVENEPHYIDFFLLSLCKHQIISNSSFGWWAAWLNQNPQKIVVVPQEWIDPKWHHTTPVKDVWPASWIKINAKWQKPGSAVGL